MKRYVERLKKWGKRTVLFALALLISLVSLLPVSAAPAEEGDVPFTLDCKSAILMEASTGKILFEQNADEPLPPASVTKVMTLLLVMEEIEAGRLRYEDMVSASAHASSMGGSQIYLKEGEEMTVEELLKSVVIASANDAAVTLAEHIAGSEESFVARMNQRAAELGMKNTSFENTNGLDDTAVNHVTSARDIALMSRALIEHEKITEYSSIWMDTIRNGAFGLTNTNRLVRFYRGATGLKTGSTAKAGFCISATAKREGMELIAVIMGAPSRDIRNTAATKLLDWGFANFGIFEAPEGRVDGIPVIRGEQASLKASYPSFRTVVKKNDVGRIQAVRELPECVNAPVGQGAQIGRVVYSLDGETLGDVAIRSEESVQTINFWGVLWRILRGMAFC